MIELTSISGEEFVLNSALIYKVEEMGDTMITLVDGKLIRVVETSDAITDKVIAFQRRIHTFYKEDGR